LRVTQPFLWLNSWANIPQYITHATGTSWCTMHRRFTPFQWPTVLLVQSACGVHTASCDTFIKTWNSFQFVQCGVHFKLFLFFDWLLCFCEGSALPSGRYSEHEIKWQVLNALWCRRMMTDMNKSRWYWSDSLLYLTTGKSMNIHHCNLS
jgi:hypothetical protein